MRHVRRRIAADESAAVVHGAGDALLDVENGEALAAAIPGAHLTVVEGCGHMSARESPAAVSGAQPDALLHSVA